MENAVAELMQENNGGVLVWFLELLWAHAKTEEEDAAPPPYLADVPSIPHSVLFNYSHAQGWFFELSRTLRSASCLRRIRRKRRQHLVARDIFDELSTVDDVACGAPSKPSKSSGEGHSNDNNDTAGQNSHARPLNLPAHQIVAQLITKSSLKAANPSVTYLTYDALDALLFRGTIAEGSILQKFVPPQGAHSDPLANSNAVLSVLWQPTYCYVERCVNVHCLGDKSKTAHERGATVEDVKQSTSQALCHNATTLHRCKKACNAMALHVLSMTGLHLRSMVCVMKINTENKLILLYVQRVAVVENERLVPNLVSGRVSSSDDEDDELASLSVQQREHVKALRKCTSEAKRQYIRSLVSEETADAKFAALAPHSWLTKGRAAYRFAAIPSRVASNRRPGSETPSGHGQRGRSASTMDFTLESSMKLEDATVGAASPTTLLSAADRSFVQAPKSSVGTLQRSRSATGMSVRGFVSSMRDVELELATRTEASVVVSSLNWSEAPSRVEVALLKDTRDAYPTKRVAHSAANLGLREKYLSSMRSASLGKPLTGLSGW